MNVRTCSRSLLPPFILTCPLLLQCRTEGPVSASSCAASHPAERGGPGLPEPPRARRPSGHAQSLRMSHAPEVVAKMGALRFLSSGKILCQKELKRRIPPQDLFGSVPSCGGPKPRAWSIPEQLCCFLGVSTLLGPGTMYPGSGLCCADQGMLDLCCAAVAQMAFVTVSVSKLRSGLRRPTHPNPVRFSHT